MTLGEKLLELTTEYQQAKEARDSYGDLGGVHTTREPAAIAADYEAVIKDLLAK